LPLGIFDELTATVPALVILLSPMTSAVFGDIVRATGGTGHLDGHECSLLCDRGG